MPQDRADRAFVPTAPLADDYWAWRVSYPSGRFDGRWLLQAADQDRAIAKGMPAGVQRDKGGALGGLLDPGRATELGPRPLDWGTASLPYGEVGGRTNVLLTHPTDPAIVWLGSDGGGIWKTTNCCSAATVWTPKTEAPSLSNIAIGALVLDPLNPDVLYAGTGDFRRNRPFTFGAGGLLKSVDGGESWVILGAEVFNPAYDQNTRVFPQYRAISAIAVDPNQSQRLLVGTNQGLYLSQNGGQDWTGPCYSNAFVNQRQDITGLLIRDLGASAEVIVAIGAIGRPSAVRSDLTENGANGIYRAAIPASASCPVDWTLLSRANNGWPQGSGNGLPYYQPNGNPLRRIDLAAAPSNPAVIYAQVQDLGVWRSSDGGQSWTQTARQPEDFATGCVQDSHGNGMLFQDYNAGLLVHPGNPETVILSSTDVWRSTDGGQSFRNLSCGYDETAPGVPGTLHVDNHARAFVGNSGNELLVGHDGGVHYSADILSNQPVFQSLNATLATIEFYSGVISANFNDPQLSERYVGGGAQDNGASNVRFGADDSLSSATWTLRNGGDGINVAMDPILGRRWYYSSQFLIIMASTTGFDGPADTEISLPGWQNDRRGFLAPFRLYTNGGEESCPAASGCQRMLAGTYRVWEHRDGGVPNTQWYPNSPDLTKALSQGSELSIINALEFAPSDPASAYVGTNDGNAWYGHGLGQGIVNSASWVNLTDGNSVLPNRPIMDVAPHPTLLGEALVGLAGFDQNTPATPGHVYRLRCSAQCASFEWTNLSGNLPNIPVNALLINPRRPQQVFAGTDWGLYYSDDIESVPVLWRRFEAGLPPAMIWDLVVDRGATTLAIFTRSRGAWAFPLPDAALESINYSYTWWNPQEPGWGFNLSHQGDLLYGTWYSYAEDGKPMFLTVEAQRNADGGFSGPVYRVAGTPFAQINGSQAFTAVTEVGSAQLRFDAQDQLSLSYSIGGGTQTRLLERFIFAANPPVCTGTTASRATADNYSDLWWNASEAGWGLTLSHQGETIFLLWYTYGDGGRDQWISGGTLLRQPDGSFAGSLQRPDQGTPLLQIKGPATSFPVPEVGSAMLEFSDGESGTFTYTLDGVTQSKAITRFVAVGAEQAKPLCRAPQSSTTTGGSGSP